MRIVSKTVWQMFLLQPSSEIGGSNASNIRGHRDLETEELIEDQQQRIRELERINTQFKDKLMVAKNQIMAVHQQSPNQRGYIFLLLLKERFVFLKFLPKKAMLPQIVYLVGAPV